jgi:LCP family protein required for cell wall assembly
MKVSQIIAILTIIALGFFSFILIKANFIPLKYLIVIISCFGVFNLLFAIVAFKKMSGKVLFIFDLLAIVLIILQCFVGMKAYSTLSFLKNNFIQKENVYEYYVLASKQSDFNSLSDVNTDTVYLFQNIGLDTRLDGEIKSKVQKDFVFVEDLTELLEKTSSNKEYVSVLDSEIYNVEAEDNPAMVNNIKIIDKFTITLSPDNSNKNESDIIQKPFIVYISGIDTRGEGMPVRSLSDVNIYMVINPKDHKILLVHIPRDAYVQLHGTKGLKDKLTHAGSRGGIQLSKSTMADIFGVEADYYIRVNFHAVENLVNAVGGLTIYNDMNYTVHSAIDKACNFKPGYNDVDGRCALAFARERKSYAAGDAHRGENQEQIIKLLVEKVSSSRTLINNYENILKALDNTINTDLTDKNVSDLVKMQLDTMPKWTIETQNITGTGALKPTYSYPRQNLWVMDINSNSLKQAQEQIKELLN